MDRWMQIIYFFTFVLAKSSGYSSWMIIGNIALSTPFGRHTCEQMPLVRQQKLFCKRDPKVIASVRDATRLSVKECQHQFRKNRWNCSISNEIPGGVFGKIVQRGSQEAAFVHAITSAGVTHAVTQACSRGILEHCSCNKKKRGKSRDNSFFWGGCSDDVKYGMRFAKAFIDAAETSRYDARANMNRHNNRVGRRAVRRFMQRKCKCHGPTSTCSTQTCWDQLESFRSTGDYLKSLYDVAARITVKQDGAIVTGSSKKHKSNPPNRKQLVYLETSPNYCVRNQETGSLGTAERMCNNTSRGEDGCNSMCCGRGYNTQRMTRVEKCNCTFHWCCDVVCQNCSQELDVHTCKPESERDPGVSDDFSIPLRRDSAPATISKRKLSSLKNARSNCRRLKKRKNKRRKGKNRRCDPGKRKKASEILIRTRRQVVEDERADESLADPPLKLHTNLPRREKHLKQETQTTIYDFFNYFFKLFPSYFQNKTLYKNLQSRPN